MYIHIGSKTTLDEAYITSFFYEDDIVEHAVFVPNKTHPLSFQLLLTDTNLDLQDFKREHTFDGNYLYYFTSPNLKVFHEYIPILCINARNMSTEGAVIIY